VDEASEGQGGAGLDGTAVPRLSRGVRLRLDEAREVWVLLAPERVLKPDPIAVEILKRLDGETALDDIIDDLAQTFSADRARVNDDVRGFLTSLAEKGLVEFGP
jgi:coenzyme PQQ biosynthesis protein PqqD